MKKALALLLLLVYGCCKEHGSPAQPSVGISAVKVYGDDSGQFQAVINRILRENGIERSSAKDFVTLDCTIWPEGHTSSDRVQVQGRGWGRFGGLYVESGSDLDEMGEKVAMRMVRNWNEKDGRIFSFE